MIFADAILIIHVVFVVFVVLGLLLICAGGLRNWSWVRNLWFRLAHLLSVGIVVLQSWLGMLCPLTVWEVALREKAGDVAYTGSFVAHWLSTLIYYEAPTWVFIVSYTIFGAVVIATWIWVRPRSLKG